MSTKKLDETNPDRKPIQDEQPDWLPTICQCEHEGHIEVSCTNDTAFKVGTDGGRYFICVYCKAAGHMSRAGQYKSMEEL